MKITEDVRKYAAAQGVKDEELIKRGLEEKAAEFVRQGIRLYSSINGEDA